MSHIQNPIGGREVNNKSLFLLEVNRLLIENYAITFDDTGYDDDEWVTRFGDLENAEASVNAYGEKYDLKSVKDSIG